LMIILEN